MIGHLSASRLLRGATLCSFLALFVLVPGLLHAQDAAFQAHLKQNAAQLSAEGWPTGGQVGKTPTTDVECQAVVKNYLKSRKRFEQFWRGRRDQIRRDPNMTPEQKKVARADLRGKIRKYSLTYGQRYVAPIALYLKEKVNYEAKRAGRKPKMPIVIATGTKPNSAKWLGIISDIDMQGSPELVEAFHEKIKQVMASAQIDLGPSYMTENLLDVTLHRMGETKNLTPNEKLVKLHEGAASKETYLCIEMEDGQAARRFVELQDHMKKAEKGLTKDAYQLFVEPDVLRSTAKGLQKALLAVKIDDAELGKSLKAAGVDLPPKEFRALIDGLRDDVASFTPEDLNLTPENVANFQDAVGKVFAALTDIELVNMQTEMAKVKQAILVAEKNGNPKEAARLKALYDDSRKRVVAATEANEGRYKKVKTLGSRLTGIRGYVEPLQKNKALQVELVDFLVSSKGNRFMRRVAILTLNHIATKDPEAARDALEAAKQLDDSGELARDPELQKLAQDIDAVLSGRIRQERPELSKTTILLAFANRCRTRVGQLNAFLDADLKANRKSRAASALIDKWGGVEEALAYWDAFRSGGMPALATEIVRFRVPFLENVVKGEVLLATWEVICRICPSLGVYWAAASYSGKLTLMAVDYHWQSELDAILAALYEQAKFKLLGVDTFEDIKLGRWQFERTTFRDTILTRSDFLLEDTGVALGSVPVETVLRLTIARSDPVLVAFNEMLKRKDIGPRLRPFIDGKWEKRWLQVKKWWAKETINRLEERKQAEEGLLSGNLLEAMFKLDQTLSALELEELVRAKMFSEEYKAADRAYIVWQELRASFTGARFDLYSGADDHTKPVILRLAAKELRYLRAYREVLDLRQQVESFTGMTGTRDGPLRLLTGGPFFIAKPDADVQAARSFLLRVQQATPGIEARLLGIKGKFVEDAALDTGYDRRMRADLVRELAWEQGWGVAHRTLAAHYQPDDWDVVRDYYSVLFNHESWKLLFLGMVDQAVAEVRRLARQYLLSQTTSRMRRQHLKRIEGLYAKFTAHYAGEVAGRVRVLVRRQDGQTRTNQPIAGAGVTWVATGQGARESAPGTYDFSGLPPGYVRILVVAEGFSAPDGNPAGTVEVTLPELVTGPMPTATVYLVADDLAVRGHVIDDRDGAVPWAVLSLRRQGGPWAAQRAAVNVSGTFIFVPVLPANYLLAANARGFLPVADIPIKVDLPTRAGGGPTPFTIQFEPILTTVGITVVDDAGRAVPGAEVELPGQAALSDGRGRVVFGEVRPSRDAFLIVRKKGYASVRQKMVILPERAPSRIEQRIELIGGVELTVRVHDVETNTPIDAATVAVSYEGEVASAATDKEGLATFKNLRPGFVYLTVSGKGFLPRDNVEVLLRDDLGKKPEFVSIGVEMGMKVNVRVFDDQGQLIPGAYVSIDDGLDRFAPTGTSVLVPVKAGPHLIRAKARGFNEVTVDYNAVPTKRTEETIAISLHPGISLSVEVRSPSGALYHSGCMIRLIRNGQIAATARGPVNTFAGLEPGQYMVGAVAPGESMSVAGPVMLTEVPNAATLVVTLGITTSLRVMVKAAPGSPYPLPAEVTVRLVGQGREMVGIGSRVQFDNLVSGSYGARASAPGFKPGGRAVMLSPRALGQIFGTTIVLEPSRAAPPSPPPPPPQGASILDEIIRSQLIVFSLDVPVWMQWSSTTEGAGTSDTVESFSAGLSGTVSWIGRTFTLLYVERQNETGSIYDERTELKGTLSPDGRTIVDLTFTMSVRGSRTTWQTFREIPGEPKIEPELDTERTWRMQQRVVMRNLSLTGGGNSTFAFDLKGAPIMKALISASSSAHDQTKSHSGFSSDQQSSRSITGLRWPGHEDSAKLKLLFGNQR